MIVWRAEKMKNRFGDEVHMGRFAGFDLFLRPAFSDTVEVVLRGKNSYSARVTDTALGTIRSVEPRFKVLKNAPPNWRPTSLSSTSVPRNWKRKLVRPLRRKSVTRS